MNTENERVKKMTNEQFIVNLMNFHPSGALIQAYVIEALRFYSKMVGRQDPVNFKDQEKQFIDPKAWRAIGIDVYKQVIKKYGGTADDELVMKEINTINKRLREEAAEAELKRNAEAKEDKKNRPKYEH